MFFFVHCANVNSGDVDLHTFVTSHGLTTFLELLYQHSKNEMVIYWKVDSRLSVYNGQVENAWQQ